MRKLFFVVITLFISASVVGQSPADPVLLTVAGENISKSEFERVYRKNNNRENLSDPAAVREYLELYINYKLKVKEAEEEKLDTGYAFITELGGYRKQLAQPYLTDKDVSDALLKEAYDRLQKDISASHVLIKVDANALPKDTMEGYMRATLIRDAILGKSIPAARIAEYDNLVKKNFSSDATKSSERINSVRALNKLKGTGMKETFENAARTFSDDPSAKDNGGNLGYFTGLMMVYPFESAAFNTKSGEISMPVRTKYGYHIILVNDIRPAAGEIHAAHIMVKAPGNSDDSTMQNAKKKIDEIYARLKAGEKFEDLASQFSDDKGSAKNGGALPWFGTGRMVADFEKVAFALKNDGDYSEPFKTTYGYHIVKRLEKRGVPPFEEKKGELKNQVQRDSRSEMSKTSMISKIKAEYSFKEITKNKDELINALDTNLLNGDWKPENVSKYNKPLFTLGNKTYTQTDFANYIASHQSKRSYTTAQAVGYALYDNFVNDKCLEHEENRLDTKYPEFKSLMREYRDGILLFDLTDKKVWSKAVKDSIGLQKFYFTNKENYKWGNRVQAVIYTCANKDIASRVRKMLKKNTPVDDIRAEINKESQLNLSVKEGKFSKGDHDVLDSLSWVVGLSPDIEKNGQVVFADIKKILLPETKTLEEAKGLITADYQNHLEKTWISELRTKYPVTINEQVLTTVGK